MSYSAAFRLDEPALIVRIRARSAGAIRQSTQGVDIVSQESDMFAPGWPGIPARWTSSAKSGLGTSISRDSRVWFTLSHGILNEISYPRVDRACTRDLRRDVLRSAVVAMSPPHRRRQL